MFSAADCRETVLCYFVLKFWMAWYCECFSFHFWWEYSYIWSCLSHQFPLVQPQEPNEVISSVLQNTKQEPNVFFFSSIQVQGSCSVVLKKNYLLCLFCPDSWLFGSCCLWSAWPCTCHVSHSDFISIFLAGFLPPQSAEQCHVLVFSTEELPDWPHQPQPLPALPSAEVSGTRHEPRWWVTPTYLKIKRP